ncbi:MAG: hypothetical protein M3P08_03530 [Thermoproteota archaeon]|nr:hypothetical protein [Thermoproteota archaeon]
MTTPDFCRNYILRMCHVACDRRTTIVRTIPATIVAIHPNIMTFRSFSDDLILPPQLQLSHHKEMSDRSAVPEKEERRGPL